MSHSHRAKALVRAIHSYLPEYISAWWTVRALDSADIDMSIRKAIQDEADFVIIFLGREAMKSEWVRRECECVLEREKQIGRVFVLPVLPY